MIPAMPRPMDKRPKAFVNLPRPNRSQRTIDVRDMNAAERNKVVIIVCGLT